MSVEIRIRVVFYGKVQGVGFRRQVKLKADALHIKGFIRNCQSGSVESVLIGPASSIDLLLKDLQSTFEITTIKKYEAPSHVIFNDCFEILFYPSP